MILVDTCIWADHIDRGDPRLAGWLEDGVVLAHPLVVEELACGRPKNRTELFDSLATLPLPPIAGHEEVLALIDAQALAGSGLGAVDIHLLASARLAGARLATRDKALAKAAKRLGVLAD